MNDKVVVTRLAQGYQGYVSIVMPESYAALVEVLLDSVLNDHDSFTRSDQTAEEIAQEARELSEITAALGLAELCGEDGR